MKEYIYSFNSHGYFLENLKNTACFGEDACIRLIIKPIEYELKVSNDILNKASCKGYKIEITNKGKSEFYNYENILLAALEETEKEYKEFKFEWKENSISVLFGHTETVDNYPNCDGEFDRWSTTWVADFNVTLDTEKNETTVF